MSQLITRGTALKEISAYCSENGQFTVEAKCRCSWSENVCNELGWTFNAEGFGNGSLEGKLLGISWIMEPNGKALKDYRFDLTINSVGKFRHILTKEDHHELEYVVTTVADDAIVVLSNYLAHCGPGEDLGQAKIVYNAEEQTTLGEGGAPADEKPRGRRKAAEAVQ